MKLRGTVLKRIRFSCKNIIGFGLKYKIKATEDSFDLFLCESFTFLPTTFSECQKGVPLVTTDWIMCGHVTQHGQSDFIIWRNTELGHGDYTLHSEYLRNPVELEDEVAIDKWIIKLRSWLEERR